MEQSGNMYLLGRDEQLRAKALVRHGEPLREVLIDGPCMIRHEKTGFEPGVGTVLSVQIGLGVESRVYLVAPDIRSVVFSRE